MEEWSLAFLGKKVVVEPFLGLILSLTFSLTITSHHRDDLKSTVCVDEINSNLY